MRTGRVEARGTALKSSARTTPAVARVGDPYGGIKSPILQEAASQVAASWRNESGDAVDGAELQEVLVALARTVESQHGKALTAVDARLSSVLGQRLLELLRAETVRGWQRGTTAPDPSLLLDLLEAFERVREAIEPHWANFFSSRLSGPDGLELVVEVAHDLRSPLTSILFLAETLQRGQSGELNEVQRRQLGLIYSAALGLSSAASDLIELARGGDRLVDRDPAPLSVTEILESVRDIVRPIAEEKGLTIRLLPPTTDHRLGHRLALSRVLLNLTTNALKFTDEGSVEITTREKGLARVEFSVRDTGRGINSEALSSLYLPFRRIRGRSGYGFSGTGLGLAICRQLVQAMASDLKVETRPDWGTRFFFELDLPPASHL